MGLKDFFLKDVETKDHHSNPIFRTHYYKCDYRKAKEELMAYFTKIGYKVANVDDNYHEIFIENPNFHLIVTINRAEILTVGIDIKINIYTLFGGYKPHKIVQGIYDHCDKNLPYVKLQPKS